MYISEASLGIFFRMSASRLLSIAFVVVSTSRLHRRYLMITSPLGVMCIVVTVLFYKGTAIQS